MIKNKKMLKLASLIMVLALVLVACGQSKEDVAATVNGKDISMEAFIDEYKVTATSLVNQFGEEYLEGPAFGDEDKTMDEALKEVILQNMIQIEIALQAAEEEGIEVTEEDIDEELNNVMELYGGEEAFKAGLEDQGLTMEYHREFLKNSMIIQELTSKKQEDFKPSEEELQKYFEDNKDSLKQATASHILVEDEDQAKDIKNQLDEGADFAELAKEHSLDEANKEDGGSLGTFGPGMMVPEFEEAVFSMEEGEISEPVETDFGFHIIKLDKIDTQLEGQEDQVEDQYIEEKITEYFNDLEDKAKVETYVDYSMEIPLDLPEEEAGEEEPGNDQENTGNEDQAPEEEANTEPEDQEDQE